MTTSIKYIALDIGERRIGVAAADSDTKLAYPVTTLDVDGAEVTAIGRLIAEHDATVVVVGYPRNQAGEPTQQTSHVEQFVKTLIRSGVAVVYQDESLTSVAAEQHLRSLGRPYGKADVDAHAAVIILTDYLEAHVARYQS